MTNPNGGFTGQPNQWQPQQQPPQQGGFPQQQQQVQPWNPQQSPVQQGPSTFVVTEPSMVMPQPQFPQQQQQQQQNGPQYAPAWQGGQPLQPQQQGQPGFSPQQQQRPVAPAQGVQLDQQGRMFGPGVPQELQGKTIMEGLQTYNLLRQGYIQTQQQQPQRQPVPQQQPQQQTPSQQGQVNAQAPTRNFWANPEEAIGNAIDQRLERLLAPVLQQTQQTQIEQAANAVRALHPQQFAQHEAAVIAKMQGLPPETLANPIAWRLALTAVIGEQTLQGGSQQPQQQNQQQPNTPWNPQPRQQMPWEQATQPQPQQNLHAGQFFSESPSAGMQNGWEPNGSTQLSPQQKEMARRFNLTEAQYLQGMGARL